MSGAREVWRRLRRGLGGGSRLDLFYSRDYRLRLGSAPIDPRRGEKILAFLLGKGLAGPLQPRRPAAATLAQLARVHSGEYLGSLQRPGALVPIVGYDPGDEVQEQALAAQRAAVGGTLAAARRALARRTLTVNLGGGLHHARPDRGGGFCIFNDVAVAIAALRHGGFDGPVFVADLDLHDGDGTRHAFAEDASVFTFSLHNRSWSDEPAVASRSIDLGEGVEDERYREALATHLPEALAAFAPELVFYLAGTDVAADDPLGNWRLSASGILARDRFVADEVRKLDRRLPVVVTLAGGYGRETWRYSARFLAWLAAGHEVEPPSTTALTMARYRQAIERLPRSEPSAPDHEKPLFELSAADVYGDLVGAKPRTRFLEHFSRHGLEWLLERCGLLVELRAMGFAEPVVEFDLGASTETMRLFGDRERNDLLVELRLSRDERTVRGMSLLTLEWLLLQNPRAQFSLERPPLPGQKHPGLGLLADVMTLIVVLCEELEIDGISFAPSHYHLAAKGRKFLRFADPADEAFVAAIERAVAGLPLAEATRAVSAGRVVNAAGEPVDWRPMTMILPISERLRQRIEEGRGGEQEAPRAAPLDFRLAS